MRPVLFTQRVEIVEAYGERRDSADQRIGDFISMCGFLPVPLPNNPQRVEEIFRLLSPAGIVLTGGNSLVKYGGNAPERDATDRRLLEIAVRDQIPLYGFCRGMQSILDFFGNTLINVEGHVAVRHMVKNADEATEVNSYHNQACEQLSSDQLEIKLRSEDGVIEKIVHRKLKILGTMWHPERESPYQKRDLDMVRNLFGGKN